MLWAVVSAVSGVVPAGADTLEWALVQAYQNNPSLNAQRAALRAADENVPQALSGYRPKLSATASGGYNYFREVNKAVNQSVFPNSVNYTSIGESLPTRQFGATATQTLFNGFQTANRTRQAESQVAGARETLRVTEQQVLTRCRHRLHEFDTRPGDPRSQSPQRRSAHRATETNS
jgi:outer membrane protein